jgi:hypothetical protein
MATEKKVISYNHSEKLEAELKSLIKKQKQVEQQIENKLNQIDNYHASLKNELNRVTNIKHNQK